MVNHVPVNTLQQVKNATSGSEWGLDSLELHFVEATTEQRDEVTVKQVAEGTDGGEETGVGTLAGGKLMPEPPVLESPDSRGLEALEVGDLSPSKNIQYSKAVRQISDTPPPTYQKCLFFGSFSVSEPGCGTLITCQST